MLQRYSYQRPSDKSARIEKSDFLTETWIVPDLKTKTLIEEKFLANKGFVPHNAVLRVSDFWKTILREVNPSLEVISPVMMEEVIEVILKERSESSLLLKPGSVLQLLTQLSGVLFSEQAGDLLLDWFTAQPSSLQRWGQWVPTLKEILSVLLIEKKLILSDWIPNYLLTQRLPESLSRKKLILDLGSALRSSEAEVFLELSKLQEIESLEPHVEIFSQYSNGIRGCKRWDDLEIPVCALESQGKSCLPELQFLRMSTMLSESKDVTARIRQLIEAGVRSSDIIVLAPDIGMYWDVLSPIWREEGIVCQRPEKSVALSFAPVQRWFAQMRLHLHDATFSDLQSTLFLNEGALEISFQEFSRRLSTMSEDEDLTRYATAKNRIEGFSKRRPSGGLLSWNEFLEWSFPLVENLNSSQIFLNLFSKMSGQFLDLVRVPAESWLKIVEDFCRHQEIVVQEGEPNGIQLSDLASSDQLEGTHVFVLGLTQRGVSSQSRSLVDLSDAEKLISDLGIFLEPQSAYSLEVDLKLLCASDFKKIIFYSPMTSFLGESEAPARFWILENPQKDHDSCLSPQETRWDLLQKQSASVILDYRLQSEGSEWNHLRLQRVEEDQAGTSNVQFKQLTTPRLSATSIETYLKCPFIFASQKLFNVDNLPDFDIDPDPMIRGSLLHLGAERIMQEKDLSSWSEEKIFGCLKEIIQTEKIHFGEKQFLSALILRTVRQLSQLVNFENEKRIQIPELRFSSAEVDVQGWIQPETGSFSVSETDGSIPFRGKIDRMDELDDGRIVLFDYKSSGSKLFAFNSWLEKRIFQLGVYGLAVESGLTSFGPREVVGAYYLNLSDLNINRGWFQKETAPELGFLKGTGISGEEKGLFQNALQKTIQAVAVNVQRGIWSPKPADSKDCLSCNWSTFCRVPRHGSDIQGGAGEESAGDAI